MSEKLTEELLNELIFTSSIDQFLTNNNNLECMSLSQYLNYFLDAKGLKKAEVIKKSRVNSTFAYQIFSGDRQASRDKLLQLAIAMELNLKETQKMLKLAGVNELYCKDRRDAIIIYCISLQMSLEMIEDTLYCFNEATICDK